VGEGGRGRAVRCADRRCIPKIGLSSEVSLQVAQQARHLSQQGVQLGVAVLDGHHFGQADRMDGLGQFVTGQLPQQQEYVDCALYLARLGWCDILATL